MAYNTKIAAALVVGLGGAATLGVGTLAGTVAAGNDSRIVGAVQNTVTVAGAPLSSNVSAATIASALGLGAVTATGADIGAARAALFPEPAGPFTTSDYLGGATTTGVVEPRLGAGRSLAFSLYKRTNVLGVAHVIITHTVDYGSPTRGWYIHVWSGGNIELSMAGMSGSFSLGGWDALALGRHSFAISFFDTGSGVQGRYSIDGGAVQTTTTRTGTYVPPITSDPLWIGRSNVGGFERPMTCADLYAIMATSTLVSDADLLLLSAATGEFPTVASGTVAFLFSVPRDLTPGFYIVRSGVGGWNIVVNGRLGRRAL